MTASISNLPKTQGSPKWQWTREDKLAFQIFIEASTDGPILQHFHPEIRIIMQTDGSSFAIAAIPSQYDGNRIVWPVTFYSRKCSLAKQNYDTYGWDHLVIVKTRKQSRHYLEGTNQMVLIQCDHKNLEFSQTSKVLSQSQARWVEILSSYNFVVEHLERKKNPADIPSRRSDYGKGYERPTARLMEPLESITVERYAVCETVEDCRFGSRSGFKLNCCQIASRGYHCTWTVNLGTVQEKSPNLSELVGLVVGPSIDSNKRLVIAVW